MLPLYEQQWQRSTSGAHEAAWVLVSQPTHVDEAAQALFRHPTCVDKAAHVLKEKHKTGLQKRSAGARPELAKMGRHVVTDTGAAVEEGGEPLMVDALTPRLVMCKHSQWMPMTHLVSGMSLCSYSWGP